MEKLLHTDEKAVETLYQGIIGKRIRTIVTDVTMAASGIRKGALERLGIKVKCYLGDPRTAAMQRRKASPAHKRAHALPLKTIQTPFLYSATLRQR